MSDLEQRPTQHRIEAGCARVYINELRMTAGGSAPGVVDGVPVNLHKDALHVICSPTGERPCATEGWFGMVGRSATSVITCLNCLSIGSNANTVDL